MLHILWSIIIGFIIGLIARVGGFLGRLISKPREGQPVHPAGLLMSVVRAILLIFIWGKMQGA